jgi:hypothetical protein
MDLHAVLQRRLTPPVAASQHLFAGTYGALSTAGACYLPYAWQMDRVRGTPAIDSSFARHLFPLSRSFAAHAHIFSTFGTPHSPRLTVARATMVT